MRRERERGGGAVAAAAVEPPADEQERDPEPQREEPDGGGVGSVVADLLKPPGPEVAAGVDDLARRRIDESPVASNVWIDSAPKMKPPKLERGRRRRSP